MLCRENNMKSLHYFCSGQSMVDYGLIIALLSVVVIVSGMNLGSLVNKTYSATANSLLNAQQESERESNQGASGEFGTGTGGTVSGGSGGSGTGSGGSGGSRRI